MQTTMREIAAAGRTPAVVDALVALWVRSVAATHTFLNAAEREAIQAYVPDAIRQVATLVVSYDASGAPVGWMGIDGSKLEMLFLEPACIGKGLGRALLTDGIRRGVCTLVVNEQNPQARGFYEHMGFVVAKRSAVDELGNPYPVLTMRLAP